jgi:hypothetical protein
MRCLTLGIRSSNGSSNTVPRPFPIGAMAWSTRSLTVPRLVVRPLLPSWQPTPASEAVVLGGLDQNALEALMVMPLIENSTRLLDTSAATVFEKASSTVGHPGTSYLVAWLTRAPQDRTLKSMGFVESSDEGGFRYKFERKDASC